MTALLIVKQLDELNLNVKDLDSKMTLLKKEMNQLGQYLQESKLRLKALNYKPLICVKFDFIIQTGSLDSFEEPVYDGKTKTELTVLNDLNSKLDNFRKDFKYLEEEKEVTLDKIKFTLVEINEKDFVIQYQDVNDVYFSCRIKEFVNGNVIDEVRNYVVNYKTINSKSEFNITLIDPYTKNKQDWSVLQKTSAIYLLLAKILIKQYKP